MLDHKHLIVQMIVGSSTQYLTKTQGTLTKIEEALIKIIRNFIQNDGSLQISMDHLYLPKTKGGIKLLNIKSRNEAIQITWLCTFLDLTPH